jgi:hypothetical protein
MKERKKMKGRRHVFEFRGCLQEEKMEGYMKVKKLGG